MITVNARRQAQGWNPDRVDPTRTTMLRRAWLADLRRRFAKVRREIMKLVRHEDAFGLTSNQLRGLTANFASTQIDLPQLRLEIEKMQSQLDPADVLKLDGDPHVTVFYGLVDETEVDAVQQLLAGSGPVKARIGPLSLFENDEQDVLKFDVDSSDLFRLHEALDALPNNKTHAEYKPHVTVAYLKPGTGRKYLDLPNPLLSTVIGSKTVQFSDPNRVKTPVTLNCGGKGGTPGPCKSLHDVKAAHAELSHAEIAEQVHAHFAGKGKAESQASLKEFGIVTPPRSKAHAVEMATQRISELKESAGRTAEIGAKPLKTSDTRLPFDIKDRKVSERDPVTLKPLMNLSGWVENASWFAVCDRDEHGRCVSGEGGIHAGKLVHGTTEKSAKHFIAGTDLPERDRSKTYSEWGDDVIYSSEHQAPHQALMFGGHRSTGAGGKRLMMEFTLRPGTKVFDVSDEVTRRPALGIGHREELVAFKGDKKPSFTEDMKAWLVESRKSRGITREIDAGQYMDPEHPQFTAGEYLPLLKAYAKARGFHAIRLHDETVILDRSAIESARKLKPKEVEDLKNKPRLRKPFEHGSLYSTFDDSKPTTNAARWQFLASPDQLKQFQEWLRRLLTSEIVGRNENELWAKYVQQGFAKGAGRSFDDVKQSQLRKERPDLFLPGAQESLRDFYNGTKQEFLQSAFGRPVAVEKVKLLAARTFEDLKTVATGMESKIRRALVDGLIAGEGPVEIAREMAEYVDGGLAAAERIARTEITRAHAQGQLIALREMGVQKLGVMVEWSTAGDSAVCEKCAPMEGVVMKMDDSEAEALIPRHPNCRCAWLPANVGEDDEDQVTSKSGIEAALKKSVKLEGGSGASRWLGADRIGTISKNRPESILGGRRFVSNAWSDEARAAALEARRVHMHPSSEVESTVPQPDEKGSVEERRRSYSEDAAKIASAEFTARRVERVIRKMSENDQRWSAVHAKVSALEDKKEKLSAAHDRETKKLDKMLDHQVKALKMGLPNPYPPTGPNGKDAFQIQGEKVDAALDKFLKFRREAGEKAWKEIRKHVGDQDTRFNNGFPAMREVVLKRDGLDPSQEAAVADVEKRLAGGISAGLRSRIDETVVRSIPADKEQRAHFKGTRHNGEDQGVYLPKGSRSEDTMAHELGHSLETNANIHAAAQGFLYSRVGKEELKPMGPGYKDHEMGRDDEFSKAFGGSARYVGKHYKSDDTEVVSMGLEKMMSDPVHFAKNDPHYFKFMLGVLDGSFV